MSMSARPIRLLPRGLNQVYEEWGGEKASGALLHTKLILRHLATKREEEMQRNQHYRRIGGISRLCRPAGRQAVFWCKWSEKYINWRQLEILGLMSKGELGMSGLGHRHAGAHRAGPGRAGGAALDRLGVSRGDPCGS